MTKACPHCGYVPERGKPVLTVDNFVNFRGKSFKLSPKLARLFKLLLDAAPDPVARETLLDSVWMERERTWALDTTLRVHVSRLRALLSDLPIRISHEGKKGYRLMVER